MRQFHTQDEAESPLLYGKFAFVVFGVTEHLIDRKKLFRIVFELGCYGTDMPRQQVGDLFGLFGGLENVLLLFFRIEQVRYPLTVRQRFRADDDGRHVAVDHFKRRHAVLRGLVGGQEGFKLREFLLSQRL